MENRNKKRKYKSSVAGGDGGNKRRSKGVVSLLLPELKNGRRGFLVTYDQARTRQVRVQMLDWLREKVGELMEESTEDKGKPQEKEDDLDKAMAAEILKTKSEGEKPIVQVVDTLGSKGTMMFVLREDVQVDPVQVVRRIFADVEQSGKSRVPSAYSLAPLQKCCFASVDEIVQCAKPFLARHFAKPIGKKTFAIQIRKRLSAAIKRDEMIDSLANAIKEMRPKEDSSELKADLGNPDIVVLIETLKNVAAVAVIDDFSMLHKLNFQQAERASTQPSAQSESKSSSDDKQK